jgi:hypothetical protein
MVLRTHTPVVAIISPPMAIARLCLFVVAVVVESRSAAPALYNHPDSQIMD